MNDPGLRHRLSAILAADAVGYSRHMAEDEHATLAALDAARAVFRTAVESHQGRIIDMAGDSVLAVFDTAMGALAAALSAQRALAACAAESSPSRCTLAFRIGLHLGDVIEKADGTVYGDGVNIASRLQAIAEPGGVTASDALQIAIRAGQAHFEDIGEQAVKNIARPVRAYRVRVEGSLGSAAGAPAALAGSTSAPTVPAAARERADSKPAIAVLPFVNMSGDAEQEFFADGITEDIITELSRFKDLFVISRNSSFKYKGKPVEVQKFARELGVQYVVEGSVRKAASRVRITVQLIDAESDRHLWAERYDRELADIFAIQDEVTQAIVATLPGRVEAASRDRASRKQPGSLAAWEWVLTAKVLHHRSQREANGRALEMLDRAIALEPGYAHAHAWKACVLGQTWVNGWCTDREATQQRIFEELQIALALDDNDSDVHRILAAVHVIRRMHDVAQYHQQRALLLNPNDDLVVVQQGELLTWAGEPERGMEWIRKAMRLNPYHPERFWSHLGRASFTARRYVEAIEAFKRLTAPEWLHHAYLAACHAQLGDDANAAAHRDLALAKAPELRVETAMATQYYVKPEDIEHLRAALLAAGFAA